MRGSSWLGVGFMLVLAGPAMAGEPDSLVRAYQLEKEALQQEIRSLSAGLERARDESRQEAVRLRDEVAATRARLSALQVEADLEQDRLLELEASRAGTSAGDELLAVTLEQALVTLQRHGEDVAGADAMDDPALLATVLECSDELLRRHGSIRVEPGRFFRTDGREVDGEIIRFGEVAAMGRGDGHGGVLLPAGGEDLRLAEDDPAIVEAYLESRTAAMTPLYLFDPSTRGQAHDLRPSIWEKIRSGGALVWPILGLGLLALLIILERIWMLRRLHTRTDTLLEQVQEDVHRGHWHAAMERCQKERGAPSRILLAGLRNRHLEKRLLDDALSEAIVREMPTLDRFMPVLSVIAAVAPLLGLLGTVTGMISTFEVITEYGTGDPKMLSGGISVALVTTQLGLAVAIPVLLVQNLLSGFIEHVVGDMYMGALTLNNAIHRWHCPRLKDGTCRGRTSDMEACPFLVDAPRNETPAAEGASR